MKYRLFIAVVLVVIAMSIAPRQEVNPPIPDGPLDLAACFEGADAAHDAAIVAAMASEIADVIEYDSGQPEPLLATGWQVDQMRTQTRVWMCEGESIGDKHPKVCDAVSEYLDETVGNNGGPLSEQERLAWIDAYREIARAARATIQ